MKKLFITYLFFLIFISAQAQLKMFSGGTVSLGSSSSPAAGSMLHTRGNGLFTYDDNTIYSAAYIRGMNSFSGASTPDYTWYGDSLTGFFHPKSDTIGVSIGGAVRFRFCNGGINSFGNAIFAGSTSSITSAAYIRGQNSYSGASTPDYTWYGDDQTGLFHPNNNIMGFAVGGSEKMRLTPNGSLTIGTDYDNSGSIRLSVNTSSTVPIALATFVYHPTDWAPAQISYVNQAKSKSWIVNYNSKDNFFVTGDGGIWSKTAWMTSDSTLKENIATIIGAKSKVLALRGVSFNYKPDTLTNPADTITVLPEGEQPTQIGLIAQEVEEVVPEVVSTDENGLKAVAYSNLVGLLVEAFKEQQLSIDSLHGTTFGLCDSIPRLPDNGGMRLNDHNIVFEGQGTGGVSERMNSIGIGYSCGDPLPAKLSVDQNLLGISDSTTIAGYFHNGDSAWNIEGARILVDGVPQGVTDDELGIVAGIATGLAVNVNSVANNERGISLLVSGSTVEAIGEEIFVYPDLVGRNSYAGSYGLIISNGYGSADESITTNTMTGANIQSYGLFGEGVNSTNRGVDVYAVSGTDVTGLHTEAGGGTSSNIGIYSYSNGGGAINYGIYSRAPIGFCATYSCTDAAGFFVGDVGYTGSLYNISDAKLKENVKPLENAMSILNQLHPKSYTFKTNDYPTVSLSKDSQNGLIAQEVEQVLPNLVKSFKVLPPTDTATHKYDAAKIVDVKAINYSGIIPYLIQGIKDQQQIIDSMKQAQALSLDSLRSQLNALQNAVNSCCTGNRTSSPPDTSAHNGVKSNTHAIDVTLSNEASIVLALDQNFPNPFKEKCSIAYSIPDNVITATIMFYDNLGRVLQTVTINDRGAGKLNVFAGNLSAGIYSYSLITDGKVIDTKKMVCDK